MKSFLCIYTSEERRDFTEILRFGEMVDKRFLHLIIERVLVRLIYYLRNVWQKYNIDIRNCAGMEQLRIYYLKEDENSG